MYTRFDFCVRTAVAPRRNVAALATSTFIAAMIDLWQSDRLCRDGLFALGLTNDLAQGLLRDFFYHSGAARLGFGAKGRGYVDHGHQ